MQVLTIAHRINTILDSDRIMVLDTGEIKEFAPPDELLGSTSGLFFELARTAGVVNAQGQVINDSGASAGTESSI